MLSYRDPVPAWVAVARGERERSTSASTTAPAASFWRAGSREEEDAPGAHPFATSRFPAEEKVQVRLGVIADVQHADIDDASNFAGDTRRYYRHSLTCLRAAVSIWRATPKLAAVLQLGDLIDGKNTTHCPEGTPARVIASVGEVLGKLDLAGIPVYNSVGNHELYNFPRASLWEGPAVLSNAGTAAAAASTSSSSSSSSEGKPGAGANYSYYTFTPAKGWRVVALDAYDVGVYGWRDKDSARCREAFAILAKENVNLPTPEALSRKGLNYFDGMHGIHKRFCPFNGKVGATQMTWLRTTLRAAAAAGERVIVTSHVAVQPGACVSKCLIWNFEEVLDALHTDGAGCVAAYLNGHAHRGGYALDDHGVHHVTFQAPLETPPPMLCHGVVELTSAHVVIRGYGKVPSRRLPLYGIDAAGRAAAKADFSRLRDAEAADLARLSGKSVAECHAALDTMCGDGVEAFEHMTGKPHPRLADKKLYW